MNFYQILGVESDVSAEHLRLAYHAKLLQSHPDKNRLREDHALTHSISDLKQAYRTLCDSTLRKAYDEELATQTKNQGLEGTGSGLDTYSLEEFNYQEKDGILSWVKDCPRCTSQHSFQLYESDLELGTVDGTGGYQLLAPCLICSLWIKITYEEG